MAISRVAGALLGSVLLGACATQAELARLPEVAARRPPELNVGPELVLFDRYPRAATSLTTADGRLHVFTVDVDGRVGHLEIQGDTVVLDESLGQLPKLKHGRAPAMDAVELPEGTIRAIAGDRAYRRSGNDGWEESPGNRCLRLLRSSERLLCAWVLDGTEIGGPQRTDVSGGLVLVVPVIWWSKEVADKLALAEETATGWQLRWVVNPETTLDADPDFLAGVDVDGTVHLVFGEGRGGTYFLVAGGPSGVGGLAGDPASHLRYATIALAARDDAIQPGMAVSSEPETGWLPVAAQPLAQDLPAAVQHSLAAGERNFRPVNRHFAVDGRSGRVIAAVSLPTWLVSGERQPLLASEYDSAWALFHLCGDGWCEDIEPLVLDELPDRSFKWHAEEPLLLLDGEGRGHLLLAATDPGFWTSSSRTVYLERGPDGSWSAPLELGDTVSGSICSVRLLAVARDGAVFAAWPAHHGRFVGRWLRR